ncbi:MAG: T9SS type A sorting domain-containing protein, partial [Crocinitomicaceae bacterium]|nr:T9SS type A sorting domain-containing protein [Crocinitomicaceae bacterium]
DLNMDNSDKIFRNVSGTWQTSSYDASLLIRPVYSTALNYTLDLTVTENTDEITANVYPNPVKNILTIQTSTSSITYSIYDMTGREVLTGVEKEIEMSDLNSGVYIVQIKDSNGLSLYSGKVIKE